MDTVQNRRNKNRGCQTLRVWQDAVELYRCTYHAFKGFPFETKKIASQQIASVDSIHRNIAEGYGRRSLKEYIQFLYIGLASLAESVSGLVAYHSTGQITEVQFHDLDSLAFRLENGLINLISRLEEKKGNHDWVDHLQEPNPTPYDSPFFPDLTLPNTPLLHYSNSPSPSSSLPR